MIKKNKKIFFSIDNEWNIRYFAHTNFLYKLSKNLNIEIIILVSSNIRNLSDLKKIPNTKVIKIDDTNNTNVRKILYFLLMLVTYASANKVSKSDYIRAGYIKSVRYGLLMRKYISRFKLIRVLFKLQSILLSFLTITPNKLLCIYKNKPDLIITSTPSLSFNDIEINAISKILMIKSLCFVYSWDNLVTKGPIVLKPDFLGVWNKIMYKEAISIFNFKKANLRITGSFVYEKLFFLAKDLKKKINYESPRTLLIASHLKKYSGSSYYDVIKDIQEMENIIKYDRILFRAHPFDDLYEKKENYLLGIPNLEIDKGLTQVDKLEKFISKKSFENNLIKTILESDWIITGATTFALDALFLGKKIGLLNYLPNGKNSAQGLDLKNINESYEFEHFKRIVQDNNVSMLNSKNDLFKYLNAIKWEKNKNKLFESKVARQIIPLGIENSTEKSIKFIKEIINEEAL